jgi:hypothetical protein
VSGEFFQEGIYVDHNERWKHSVISQHADCMLEQGVVTIDMSYYLEKVLKGYDNLPLCTTPGKKNFFDVDERAELLSEAERKKFHSAVARLLCLLKRA